LEAMAPAVPVYSGASQHSSQLPPQAGPSLSPYAAPSASLYSAPQQPEYRPQQQEQAQQPMSTHNVVPEGEASYNGDELHQANQSTEDYPGGQA
jgi:hypothetical protein